MSRSDGTIFIQHYESQKVIPYQETIQYSSLKVECLTIRNVKVRIQDAEIQRIVLQEDAHLWITRIPYPYEFNIRDCYKRTSSLWLNGFEIDLDEEASRLRQNYLSQIGITSYPKDPLPPLTLDDRLAQLIEDVPDDGYFESRRRRHF